MSLSDRLTPAGTSDPASAGVPDERLQQILEGKDADAAHAAGKKYGYSESWSIIDGALVIFDFDNPPAWLKPVLDARDEDGNTLLAQVVENQRKLLEIAQRGSEIERAVVAMLDASLGGARA